MTPGRGVQPIEMRANESRLVRGGDGRGLRSAITANQSQFAGVSPLVPGGTPPRTNMAGEHILARVSALAPARRRG